MTAQQQPLTLYFWPTPNGQKISIFLEEVGLPYEIRPVDILSGAQFSPEFLAISPNNKIPALVDPQGPDGAPIALFESGAILTYLADKTGQLHGRNGRERATIDQWLFWQVGGLGPMAGQTHHFRNYAVEKIPYAIERYVNETGRLYGVLDRALAEREYVAGIYSIADIAIWPWARLWMNQGQDIERFPHMKSWLERVGAREAVKRGMAVGKDLAGKRDIATDKEAQKVLFGQKGN